MSRRESQCLLNSIMTSKEIKRYLHSVGVRGGEGHYNNTTKTGSSCFLRLDGKKHDTTTDQYKTNDADVQWKNGADSEQNSRHDGADNTGNSS